MKRIIVWTTFFLSLGFSVSAAAETALFLGDSQSVGFYGKRFYQYLSEDLGYENVHVYGVVSSSPRHWSSSKNERNGSWLCRKKGRHNLRTSVGMKNLICRGHREGESITRYLFRRERPSLVVFQFLGNSVGFSEDFVKRKIQAMLVGLPQRAKCVFITTPPHYISRTRTNERRLAMQEHFREAVGNRCQFIAGMNDELMRDYAPYKKHYARDRIHMSTRGARFFFNYVRRKISLD